jgi:hypothetical protein
MRRGRLEGRPRRDSVRRFALGARAADPQEAEAGGGEPER